MCRASFPLLVCASLAACSDPSVSQKHDPIQPAGWDHEVRVSLAEDLSPDPDVFETKLVARVARLQLVDGTETEVYTYNGVIPGPEIRVQQGDRVIIHLENELPEPTTIHWHGLRVPNDVDGVPGVTQAPVEPGSEFTYEFVVPDAGTFWYHPHANSADQVGAGLYGSFVVTDPNEPEDLGDELTLVLSDMLLTQEGQIDWGLIGGETELIFGREGNLLLVNGKTKPSLTALTGRRQRWRIINAARTRYFQVAMQDHEFLRFAGDSGMIERPLSQREVVVVPGERAEVIVTPTGLPGSTLSVVAIPYDRGFGTTIGRPTEDLMTIALSADEPHRDAPLPTLSREIEAIDVSSALEVPLLLTQNDLPDGTAALGINGIPSWDAEPLRANLGETQVWTVTNGTAFAHPFHLHGYFFQVLSIDGVAPPVLEWKDSVDVHVQGKTKLAVRFDDRPGTWMVHCHILDHAELGMMTTLVVSDPASSQD